MSRTMAVLLDVNPSVIIPSRTVKNAVSSRGKQSPKPTQINSHALLSHTGD